MLTRQDLLWSPLCASRCESRVVVVVCDLRFVEVRYPYLIILLITYDVCERALILLIICTESRVVVVGCDFRFVEVRYPYLIILLII